MPAAGASTTPLSVPSPVLSSAAPTTSASDRDSVGPPTLVAWLRSRDAHVASCATHDGAVLWRPERTIWSVLRGVDAAKAARRRWLRPHAALIVSATLLASQLIVLIGLFDVIPVPAFVSAVAAAVGGSWANTALLYDVDVLKLVVRRGQVLPYIALNAVGALSLVATFAWDYRTAFVVYWLVTVFGAVTQDALPSAARTHGTAPSVLVCLVFLVVIVVATNLGRVPRQIDVVVDLGYVGGASARPVTFSLLQAASSAFITTAALLSLQLWGHVRHLHEEGSSRRYVGGDAAHEDLSVVVIYLRGVDDPGFDELDWLKGMGCVGQRT